MFDLNDVKRAAERIGLDIEFDSDNPGMHFIKPNGETQRYSFNELESSLKKEFEVNRLKVNNPYQIEYKESLELNIGVGMRRKKSNVSSEIEISIDGHHKDLKCNQYSIELDNSQYMYYNTNKNNGVA